MTDSVKKTTIVLYKPKPTQKCSSWATETHNILLLSCVPKGPYRDMYIEKLSFHINLTFTQAVSVDLLVNAGLLSWQSEFEFGSILFNINEVPLHYCRTMNPA